MGSIMIELVLVLFQIILQDEDGVYFVYKAFVLLFFLVGIILMNYRFGFFGGEVFILYNNFYFGKKFVQFLGQFYYYMMDLGWIVIWIKGFVNDDGFDFFFVQVILQIGFQFGGRYCV